jgi:hypothetical protein
MHGKEACGRTPSRAKVKGGRGGPLPYKGRISGGHKGLPYEATLPELLQHYRMPSFNTRRTARGPPYGELPIQITAKWDVTRRSESHFGDSLRRQLV